MNSSFFLVSGGPRDLFFVPPPVSPEIYYIAGQVLDSYFCFLNSKGKSMSIKFNQ